MRLGDWVYSQMFEYNLLVEGKEPTDARKIEQVENCRLWMGILEKTAAAQGE